MFCDECEPVYMYVMQLEACSTERGLATVRPKIPLSYIYNIPATQVSARYTECVLTGVCICYSKTVIRLRIPTSYVYIGCINSYNYLTSL